MQVIYFDFEAPINSSSIHANITTDKSIRLQWTGIYFLSYFLAQIILKGTKIPLTEVILDYNTPRGTKPRI